MQQPTKPPRQFSDTAQASAKIREMRRQRESTVKAALREHQKQLRK